MDDILPANYKASIAVKKVVYIIVKVLIGYFVGKLAATIALDPAQATEILVAVTAAAAALLEAVHDWAHLKWGDTYKWL